MNNLILKDNNMNYVAINQLLNSVRQENLNMRQECALFGGQASTQASSNIRTSSDQLSQEDNFAEQ